MGKTIVITGGASGQGLSHAKKFAENGFNVVIGDVCSPEALAEAKQAIVQKGAEVLALRCDVTDYAEVKNLFQAAKDTFGTVDVVIANAGIMNFGKTWELTEEQVMRMVDIHLVGTWRTCSVAAKLMLEQGGGRIINVASTAGLKASPNLGHYAMAKAGIISLTKTLAKEVAKKGITVNVLCATMIESPMTRQVPFLDHIYQTSGVRYASFEEMNEQMKAKRPMGIAFLPIEPASELCYWAATSEAARYITGAVLPLDAGTML